MSGYGSRFDAALFVAAGNLAWSLEQAEADNARLRRMLACERGDESAAPEGWTFDGMVRHEWSNGNIGAVCSPVNDGLWVWEIARPFTSGVEESALEAMEAADAARSER